MFLTFADPRRGVLFFLYHLAGVLTAQAFAVAGSTGGLLLRKMSSSYPHPYPLVNTASCENLGALRMSPIHGNEPVARHG